jgi:NTP pyrophosphatase (non-canonical NTP hydrolase)
VSVLSVDFLPYEVNPKLVKALENMAKLSTMPADLPDCAELYRLNFDFDAITRTISDIEPIETISVDPIIPDGYFVKTQEYQEKSLEMLQAINQNTANLYTLIDLINHNNESQDEILELLNEILSIAKAKSKDEADTLFKKVMKKINDATTDVESMVKIVGWATTIYSMVKTMLPT